MLALCLILLSACASKPRLSKQYNYQCTMEMNAAMTAIHLRDQGKTKPELLQELGPLNKNSNRLHRILFSIVDEIYQFPDLNEVIYPTYRFELCAKQLTKQNYENDYAFVHHKLLMCQNKFGEKASALGTTCIRNVFHDDTRIDK